MGFPDKIHVNTDNAVSPDEQFDSSTLNTFKYTLFKGFLIHVAIKVFGHKFVFPALIRGLFAAAEIAVILSLVFVLGCTLVSTKTRHLKTS